jgi:hypothetical protein
MTSVIPAIWSISGDVAITVLGAVSVAVFIGYLTAVTTNRRLDSQLAHDRELRNVEELRSLLEDAAVLFADAISLGARVRVGFKAGDPEFLVVGKEALGALVETGSRINHIGQRVTLRLGINHPVTRAHVEARKAVRDFVKSIGEQAPLPPEKYEEVDKTANLLTQAQSRFLEASLWHVSSQFHQFHGN